MRTKTNNPPPKKQKTQNKEKNKAGDIALPDFKLYYQVIIIQRVWYWNKNKHIDR